MHHSWWAAGVWHVNNTLILINWLTDWLLIDWLIDALYLSVNVFSTNVLIRDTIFYASYRRRDHHFTWSFEPREGPASCSAKEVPSFLSWFKTLSNGSAPGIEPTIDWLIDALCKQKSRLADLPQRSKGSQCSEDFQGSKHFRRRSSAVGNDDVNPGDQHKAPIQNIPSVLQVRSRTNNKTMSDNL